MYKQIKNIYDARKSVADSINSALFGEDINRRQALEAIAGAAIGLKSFFSPKTAEAADWGIGVKAIRKVIPEGQYEVRAWNSEIDRAEQHFLYVLNEPGHIRVPFRNEPEWTVTDLKVKNTQGIEQKVMTPLEIEQRVLTDYSSVVRNPHSIEVHEEKLKNGQKVYFVRKRDIIPIISYGKLYLKGPGSHQGADSGSGPSGGTTGGGSGAPGGPPI